MSETKEDNCEAAPLGLYINENEILPLFSTEINAMIFAKFAKVQLIHYYYNPYNDYLDTSFKFPMGLCQVFDGIEAEIDGKKIKGSVGPKQKKREDFLYQKSMGSTVVEAEELSPNSTKIKGDIIITNIGNIPPYKEIKIIFSFLQSLDITLNKNLRLILPLVLTPRYIPLEKTYNLLRDYINKGNENAEEFSSMAKAGKIKFIKNGKENRLQYYYNIDIEVYSMAKIETIEAKIKNDKVIIDKINDNSYKVYLDHSELHIPNEDFVLEYNIDEEILKKPSLLLELHPKHDNDYCFYYSFNPTKLITDDKDKLKEETVNPDFIGNYIFVIGRANTMHGKRINMVKQCLIYFLKSLQDNGSKFNIICYGTKFYSIFKNNKLVNDDNINEALKLVMEFEGDMGGNEMESALKYAKENLIDNDLLNRIFVMTDGAIWGIDNCLKIVKDAACNNEYDCKFYSIGIGNGCSESLIKGIASNGDGEFELIKNEDDISDKMIYLLESSMYYCLDKMSCSLKKNNDKIIKKLDYSRKLDCNLEFYGLLNDPKLLKENSISCSFTFNNRKYQIEKEIEKEINLNKSITSDILHKFFLKSYIYSNINSDFIKELAIKYKILTKDTALYCLFQENKLNEENEEKKSLKKFVEIQNTPPAELSSESGDEDKECYSKDERFSKSVNYEIKDLDEFISISELFIKYLNIIQTQKESEYPKKDLEPTSNYIKIKIYFNNVYFYTYEIMDNDKILNEKVNEMIRNACSQLKISGKADEYEFYHENKLLSLLELNETVYKVFGTEGTLNVCNINKYNLSKEENIIFKQKMNGLWEIDSYLLSLFNLNFEQWKHFFNSNQGQIEGILDNFISNINEEIVFNIIVLCHIKEKFEGKNRVNFIIKKGIKGLYKFDEINNAKDENEDEDVEEIYD